MEAYRPGAVLMDEELKRFWQHHDRHPPVMGPPLDIGIWEGAKNFDGEPISSKKNERRE
jgi:hypothetical protein